MYQEYSNLCGIYLDDKITRLVVLANIPLNGNWCFTDLVIDEDYQYHGYGKIVINKIIEHFKNMKESSIIHIEVFSENINVIKNEDLK